MPEYNPAPESPSFAAPGAQGLDLGALSPDAASENGKLGVLHLTYLQAKDFLEKNADTLWWKRQLSVNWPGSSDFFSPWGWSLDLTNALAWDVVLHELGHAVMHGAMQSPNAGGQHKIDECYSPKPPGRKVATFCPAVAVSRRPDAALFSFHAAAGPDRTSPKTSSRGRAASGASRPASGTCTTPIKSRL